MRNYNIRNLLKHYFWGNFDTGVIFIFLSFYIWNKTENMVTIAIAFSIPVIINTIVDYFFSTISDKVERRTKLIIIGNIGSSIFLSLYGITTSIYVLYIFIFFKSLFAKVYQSSLDPYIREIIEEENYKNFISKRNIQISLGASVGGFSLIILYGYVKSIPIIFIVSGLFELYSTIYLFKLKDIKFNLKKEQEDPTDLGWVRYITVIYTVEGFAIALIINRMIIYMYEYHDMAIHNVGLVFFIVYGISNISAAKLYKLFENLSLKTMFILSFTLQAILLALFTTINKIYIIVAIWFLFELVSNVTSIYSKDRINRSLFTNIGKRFSKYRISIAIGSITGQLIISKIWDNLGIDMSFYFSSIILIALSSFILLKKRKI